MLPLLVLTALVVPAVSTYTEKGCYSLSSLQSVLTSKGQYTYQTNSYCQTQCSGYAVAATLDGSTCYCSNKLPSNVDSVSSSLCSVKCQGFPSETCGGSGYLSVYTDGSEDTAAVSSVSSATSTTTSKSASTTSTTSTQTTSSTSTSKSSTLTSTPSSTSPTTSMQSSTSSTSPSTEVSVIVSIITASQGSATTITQTVGTSSSIATASNSSSTSASHSKSSSGGLSKGAIAGIAVGSVLGVLILFAIGLVIFLRHRHGQEEDEQDEKNFSGSEKPVHNDMQFYNSGFGSVDAFNTQVPPIPYFAQENGRKRLSNGSLPDATVHNQKTLRVTNPDEFTFTNDATLYPDQDEDEDQDHSYSDDESVKRFK